jgi:hypothetical protein
MLSRWKFTLVVAIFLLALVLRLRGLDTTGLWGDQAFTLNTAMRWVNGGAMPLAANKSSVGFVNPPMIEYLYAAALFLWRDILSVSILTLLGGLLAVAVTGVVTARLFGRRAGLWAMLALAVAPWAVFWSQLIWNQTMVPPFAALALGGLMLYLAERPRAAYLIVSFAAAAAMTQVHPGSAVQLLTMALALLLFRRRVLWRHVLIGATVFVLLYVPYLIYQIGTDWADLRAIGGVAGQEATISGAAVGLSLDLIRAQGLYRAIPLTRAFDALAVALFIGALAMVVWRLWASRNDRRPPTDDARQNFPQSAVGRQESLLGRRSAVVGQRSEFIPLTVLLLWFLLPLLFYLRSSVYLQNYYLVGQWPAHFMILGIGLDTAQRIAERLAARATSGGARRGWLAVAWLLPVPFLALFAFQVFFSLRYQDARAAGDGPLLQVRHARALLSTSRRLLAERPDCRLVGLGQGHGVENSDLALLVEFVDPARVILADGGLALPQPSPCAVYLNTRPGSLASYLLMAGTEVIPDATVSVRDQTWQFYDWTEPARGDDAPLARWNNGLALMEYHPGELVPGQDMTLLLVWEVVGPTSGTAYHFGTYLLGEGDAIVAQHDGPGFDSVQWRAGDRFVTFHPLAIPDDLPSGAYRTAVALYSWPGLVRAELAGGGNTAYLGELTFAPP